MNKIILQEIKVDVPYVVPGLQPIDSAGCVGGRTSGMDVLFNDVSGSELNLIKDFLHRNGGLTDFHRFAGLDDHIDPLIESQSLLSFQRPVFKVGIRVQLVVIHHRLRLNGYGNRPGLDGMHWPVFFNAIQATPAARVSMLKPVSQTGPDFNFLSTASLESLLICAAAGAHRSSRFF